MDFDCEGSPRVGDANFVKLFDSKVPDSIRIVNKQDPVPAVPLRTQEYALKTSFINSTDNVTYY